MNNTDNIIDSREVIERIETLQDELNASAEAAWDEAQDSLEEDWKIGQAEKGDADPDEEFDREDFEPLDLSDEIDVRSLPESDERDELIELLKLSDEASGYSSDWIYGEQLIRDDYFVEYAMQLAEDIGAISKGATWPNNHIAWDKAAEALQQDYACVSYGDVDYWIRAS